jgi:hypothetical protein
MIIIKKVVPLIHKVNLEIPYHSDDNAPYSNSDRKKEPTRVKHLLGVSLLGMLLALSTTLD